MITTTPTAKGRATMDATWTEALHAYLQNREWQTTLRRFVDSHAVLFENVRPGAYSHGHYEVWKEFGKLVEVQLEAMLGEVL